MDLNAPLGMTPPPRRRRRLVVPAAGVVAATVLGGLALALAFADPQGGRPSIVALLPPPPAPAPPRQAALDTTSTGTVAPAAATVAAPHEPAAPGVRTGSLEGGVMVYRGSGVTPAQAAPGPLVIDVTRVLDDPQGKDKKPGAAAPKPPTSALATGTAQAPTQPRVAIFVSGMGLDAGATRTATDTMPAAVTLAFLPYGPGIGASVGAAKTKGHEVLLQLPMRSEGGSSPGPHALRADEPAEALKADLAWLMDRFAGYDGVTNLLGAPFTADTAAMTTVLRTVAARHLFYLDDGTSRRSVAGSLAVDFGVDAVQADLVLDATSDPAVVRANLDQLVAIAKRKGRAIGMASGLPDHLGTIARFADGLGAAGVALVPVSALARDQESLQRNSGATATR